jgi:hypothetical protein
VKIGEDLWIRFRHPHFIFPRKKKEFGFSPFPIFGVTVNFTLPFSATVAFTPARLY